MQDFHVYEVVGEILLRRSGNGSRMIVPCKVVRTRGFYRAEEGLAYLSVLATGYEDLNFDRWFSDWDPRKDNMADDPQSGRPIDIAIPVVDYERLLETGKFISQYYLEDVYGQPPFQSPVAAVLIDGVWVEPQEISEAVRMTDRVLPR